MSPLLKPKHIVVILLVMLFFGIAFATYDLPPDARKVFAGCLIAAGAFNILLRRNAARWIFRLTKSKVWAFFGEEGVQFFYLGVGITLVASGLFLLLMVWFAR
jgi:hypothetical protein